MSAIQLLRRLRDIGVHADLDGPAAKHVRVVNVLGLVGAAIMGLWALSGVLGGLWLPAAENAVVCALLLSVLWVNKTHHHLAAVTLANTLLFGQICWSVWAFGASSASAAFFPGALVIAYLTFQRQNRALAHFFALCSGAAAAAALALADDLPPQFYVMEPAPLGVFNTVVASISLTLIIASFARAVDATEDGLVAAEARADQLLLNVLPRAIAERLKADPTQAIADRHDAVTVLFADIVGFTPLSARLEPGQLVALLNGVFTAFDAICEREGALRIKTMGDGYMAVCGAPHAKSDHAAVMVRVAVQLRDYMDSDAVDGSLQVRIGLNSGPVIGGIIGASRFHYDLWGDTVNVASRMESSGVPGRVQVARGTWELVHAHADCESRGTIDVKGKGGMQTWFVDAIHPQSEPE